MHSFFQTRPKIIDREREIQLHIFVAENHLQADINSDLWKTYKWYGDVLRTSFLDFSLVTCTSLRYELKYYHRYLLERSGKPAKQLLINQVMALTALMKPNPEIKYFADITETDVRAMLLLVENTNEKNNTPLSQNYIAAPLPPGVLIFPLLYHVMSRSDSHIIYLKLALFTSRVD